MLMQCKLINITIGVFSIFANYIYDESQNKHYVYGGSDCLDKFCKILENQIQNIINMNTKK